MKLTNRILIVIFSLLLVVGVLDKDTFAISALFAIPLGFLQVLFCFIILFKWNILDKKSKLFEATYFISVISYFIIWYYFISAINHANLMVKIPFYCFPVVLAYSVTIFLEKLGQER